MQPPNRNSARCAAFLLVTRGLVATCTLAGASAALAQAGGPYSLGVNQAFGHDSNLFRTATAPTPDKYSVTSLLAGIDQPIGRQRFFASGSVKATQYEDIDQLNNTGYAVNAGVDWQTIERLAGGLNLALNQSLARYGASAGQPSLAKRNLETTQEFAARVQLGLVSVLALQGSLSHRRVGYSAAEFAASEYNQTGASVGLNYRPSGLLSLGAAVRHTRGEYPRLVLANGDAATFERNDLDLTATWVASGLSTVNARVSFGRQTSDGLTQRDFTGTTGSISWAFLPTGKLGFNTTLSRDTGAESSFANQGGSSISGGGDNSRLTTSLTLTAGYEATAKIRINATLRYSRRNLVDERFVNGVSVGAIEGVDSLKTLSLGASYEPTRAWLLGCNAVRELRLAEGGLSNNYAATTANCSAQFSLK
ncbi:MAG: hypothetical protein AD742_20530 [Methylibium sp. NZG]|nr:MAG: hypothetical protein AD742_20530 [Methylibium sp. NZG]